MPLPISNEQRLIVQLPPTAKTLVVAGAGTGKTHVIIARLAYMIRKHHLQPGSEILVLTFSRAAVREIRRRLSNEDSDARYIAAATFDSFATRLLSAVDPEGEWIKADYDGRIRAATAALRAGGLATEFTALFKHIVIDEVQDLVSDRFEFVKALLTSTECGFTLCGDPAQGIYNWQADGQPRAVGVTTLFRWLDEKYPELLKPSLITNHRAAAPNAKIALWAGKLLNGPSPDYNGIHEKLRGQLSDLGPETLKHFKNQLLDSNGNTAILCRTNGQALILSRRLHELEIPHRLQRRAVDRVLPAWIANVVGGVQTAHITRSRFLDLAHGRLGSNDPALEEAWRLLKRLDPNPPTSLDLSALAQRIHSGIVPDDLVESLGSSLVVSTIHRAKGLEFDRVFITEWDPDTNVGDGLQFEEEVRVLYVALTRAKANVFCLRKPSVQGFLEKSPRTERWLVRLKKWQIFDLQIDGDDVYRDEPAGAFLVPGIDPVSTQEYIRTRVKVGDPLKLWQYTASTQGSPRAFYTVMHGERVVGVTSEGFGWSLYTTLKHHQDWVVHWPVGFDHLTVEGIDTVAGSDASGKNAGLGSSGLWLRVRAGGMGHVIWA